MKNKFSQIFNLSGINSRLSFSLIKFLAVPLSHVLFICGAYLEISLFGALQNINMVIHSKGGKLKVQSLEKVQKLNEEKSIEKLGILLQERNHIFFSRKNQRMLVLVIHILNFNPNFSLLWNLIPYRDFQSYFSSIRTKSQKCTVYFFFSA